jgi:hypothetical protein
MIHAEVKYIKKEFPKLSPFEQALSPRIKNVLMGYYKDRKMFTNPEIIADAGKEKIFSIKNIGRKNLKEIANALYKTGCIDYDDPWLDDYRDKRIKMYYIYPERPTEFNLKNRYLGKWRITEMDLWDQDYIDMDVDGYFSFLEDKVGDFQFGLVQGVIDYRIEKFDGKERLDFSWIGDDEGSPVSGRGWAGIKRGILEGRIYFYLGDNSGFKAERAK